MPRSNASEDLIKVVLIDDHFLIHESVAHQLEGHAEFQLVATGTAGEELEPLVKQHQPDVLLLDLGIPTRAGTTLRESGRYQVLPTVRRLRKESPKTQFIILSADADAQLIEGALDAGAKGYLLKDDILSVLLPDAIRAVSKGGVYFSKEVGHRIVSNKSARPAAVLTDRQMEVLLAIVSNANLTYADHAKNLGIAEDTFNNHLRAIFEKFNASNITFAIIRAIQLGVIPAHLLGLPSAGEPPTLPDD